VYETWQRIVVAAAHQAAAGRAVRAVRARQKVETESQKSR